MVEFEVDSRSCGSCQFASESSLPPSLFLSLYKQYKIFYTVIKFTRISKNSDNTKVPGLQYNGNERSLCVCNRTQVNGKSAADSRTKELNKMEVCALQVLERLRQVNT